MEEEKKEKGFVIKDRRHFDESGAVREEEAPKSVRGRERKTEVKVEEAETHAGRSGCLRSGRNTPSRDQFRQFHLFAQHDRHVPLRGFSRSGHEGEPGEIWLPPSRPSIILSILKTKTEGNLDRGRKAAAGRHPL